MRLVIIVLIEEYALVAFVAERKRGSSLVLLLVQIDHLTALMTDQVFFGRRLFC